jgi:hypothetical protein
MQKYVRTTLQLLSHMPHITQYKHAAVFDVREVSVHGVRGAQGEGHAGGGGGEVFRSVVSLEKVKHIHREKLVEKYLNY